MLKNILLVEDEAILALATSKIIETQGFNVIHAYNGESAIETVRGHPEISLILMDIDLGKGIDGTEAARRILEFRDIPIVFLTSHSEKEYVEKVKKITKYGYVLKNSGKFVVIEAIHMAYTLFKANQTALKHLEESQNAYKELQKSEDRLKHLNRVLLSIRNINQLITKEPDMSRLLDQTCRMLIQASGYHKAWIVLMKDGKPAEPFYHAGFGKDFEPMCELLQAGTVPRCAAQTMEEEAIQIVVDPAVACPPCPFTREYTRQPDAHEEKVTMCIPLGYNNTIYGWLSVIIPFIFAQNSDDKKLLMEIADDLAYAIHNHKTEEAKQKLMKDLSLTQKTLMTALDNSHAGIAIASAPDGVLEYVNDAGLLIRGGDRKKIVDGIGINEYVASWQLMDLDGRPLRTDEVPLARAVLYGEVNSREFIVRREDKQDRIVVGNAAPIFDEAGNVKSGIVIFLDVTDHRQTARKLRENEEKYRALYENSPLPYQSLDDDGRFLDINPAWLSTLGYKRDEVIGKNFIDFLHPSYRPHFEKNFPAFKKRGYVHDVQFSIRHKTEGYRHISFEGCIGYNSDGSFRQTYCVFMDITEQTNTLQQLEATHSRLQKIVDNSPFLINEIDKNGRYTLVNEATAEFLGRKKEDLIGRHFKDILPHETAALFQDRVTEVIHSGEHMTVDDKLSLNNQTQILRTVLFPIKNREEVNSSVVGIGFDITHQVQSEEEKELLMRELNHRIKNNLYMVSSLVSLKASESGEDFSDILSQIDAIRLVHEKLSSTNSFTNVNVKEYLCELLKTVFSSFSKDPVDIDEKIENLIIPSHIALPLGLLTNEFATNAIKHGFKPGSAQFSITFLKTDDRYSLTVSNTGNPFPEQIDIHSPGSLGLQLIQTLVIQLKGEIELLQREPNPVFHIGFPYIT